VEDGLGEAEALAVALGELLDLLAIEALEAAGGDRPRYRLGARPAALASGFDAAGVRGEVEVFGDGEVLVQGDRFGQVADAALDRDGVLDDVDAVDDGRPRARVMVAGEDLHDRRLPGAVGAQEAEHRTRLRREADAVDGFDAAVALA
jgi:hypothetical protein